MGSGYSLFCKKCRFSFDACFGVGFCFPEVYQKALRDGIEGKLGKEVQSFLREHPDGALDCDRVLLQCTDCGNLESDIDYSMYLPDGAAVVKKGNWTDAVPDDHSQYVAPWDLEEGYHLFSRYNHVCGECGSRMKIIKEKDIVPDENRDVMNGYMETGVSCPKCGKPLYVDGVFNWD